MNCSIFFSSPRKNQIKVKSLKGYPNDFVRYNIIQVIFDEINIFFRFNKHPSYDRECSPYLSAHFVIAFFVQTMREIYSLY